MLTGVISLLTFTHLWHSRSKHKRQGENVLLICWDFLTSPNTRSSVLCLESPACRPCSPRCGPSRRSLQLRSLRHAPTWGYHRGSNCPTEAPAERPTSGATRGRSEARRRARPGCSDWEARPGCLRGPPWGTCCAWPARRRRRAGPPCSWGAGGGRSPRRGCRGSWRSPWWSSDRQTEMISLLTERNPETDYTIIKVVWCRLRDKTDVKNKKRSFWKVSNDGDGSLILLIFNLCVMWRLERGKSANQSFAVRKKDKIFPNITSPNQGSNS